MLRYIFSLIILLFICISYGQENLSLRQCIEIAQNKSIGIKQAMLNENDANYNIKYAKNQMFPSLSGNSSLSYNIGRRVNPTTNTYITESFLTQNYGLSSGIMLYNGNIIHNNIRKSEIDKKATEENTKQIERDLALLVANYYLSILFSEENLDNSKKQYSISTEQVNRTKKLIDAGAAAPGAALSLEAQMLNNDQKVIMAENEKQKAYLNLKNLLQLDINKEISIEKPDLNKYVLEEKQLMTLEEIINQSLNFQPQLAEQEYKINSSKLNEQIARGMLYPSLVFFGGISTDFVNKAQEITGYTNTYQYSNVLIGDQSVNVGFPVTIPTLKNQTYFNQLSNNLGYALGLQLKIPIYDNYSTRNQIQKAKYNTELNKLNREQTILNIKSQVQSAYADYKAATVQFKAAQKSFDAQKLAYENSKKQYDLGVIAVYDYLSSENLFEQSQNNLLLAKYDFIFKSIALDFYLGKDIKLKN